MNNMLRITSTGAVVLCARKSCCPIMEDIGNNKVKITDDNGNFIIIDKTQAALVTDGLAILEKNNQELLCE